MKRTNTKATRRLRICPVQGKALEKARERFMAKVELPDKEDGCWLWIGAKNLSGYGSFEIGGRTWRAHRAVWVLFVGPIPRGKNIRHIHCHNPGCVRPDHLMPGSQADNMGDMVRDGRSCKGERNPRAQLTKLQATYIRKWGRAKYPTRILAKLFPQVHLRHIQKIIAGESWKDQTDVFDGLDAPICNGRVKEFVDGADPVLLALLSRMEYVDQGFAFIIPVPGMAEKRYCLELDYEWFRLIQPDGEPILPCDMMDKETITAISTYAIWLVASIFGQGNFGKGFSHLCHILHVRSST